MEEGSVKAGKVTPFKLYVDTNSNPSNSMYHICTICTAQVQIVPMHYINIANIWGFLIPGTIVPIQGFRVIDRTLLTGFRVSLPDQTLLRFRYFINITNISIRYYFGTVEMYYRVQGSTTKRNPTKVQVFQKLLLIFWDQLIIIILLLILLLTVFRAF